MSAKVKKVLNKFFKAFIILFGIGLVINIVIIIGVYLNHVSKLSDEEGFLIQKPGQMLTVDNYSVHTYYKEAETPSDVTLVFIHNTGTTDSAITLQPVLARLDNNYNVAYVDRPGNGYSPDDSNYEGKLDEQLKITRDAIIQAGAKAPYILVANGNAALMMNYWVAQYPDEVEAVIGIGTVYAEEFDTVTQEEYCGFFKWVLNASNKIGGQRFGDVYPTNYNAIYTEKQMNIRKALISKNYYTDGIYSEEYEMVNNAKISLEAGFPTDIPCLELISNIAMEPYCTDDGYVQAQLEDVKEKYPDFNVAEAYNLDRINHFSQYENVTIFELSGPSELYSYIPDDVANYIQDFVENQVR